MAKSFKFVIKNVEKEILSLTVKNIKSVTKITSGQSNLTKMPHRRRTQTVQSYSSGGANVQPRVTHASRAHPSPQPKGIWVD